MKGPQSTLLEKVEGLFVIILTSLGSVKTYASTLARRRPYTALLLLITFLLFLPLLGGLVASVIIILTGAFSSAVVTVVMFLPLVSLICTVSFTIWFVAVGITFVYRRTLAGSWISKRAKALAQRRMFKEATPDMSEPSLGFASLIPRPNEVWPEIDSIGAPDALFRPTSAPYEPVDFIFTSNPHACSTPSNSMRTV